jgi:hypothetical protein
MTRELAVLMLAALGSASIPAGARAETMTCGKRSDLLAHFQQSYHEVPNVLGLTTDGRLLEVIVAPSGSWTMLVTAPGGPSCIVATGQDWQSVAPVSTDPEA